VNQRVLEIAKSSRVENQLKAIKLRARKVEKERVAIVYLERCSDNSCSRIMSIPDSTKVINRHKARFRYREEICSDMVSEESNMTLRL